MPIEDYEKTSEEDKTRINFQDDVGNYLLGDAKWALDAGHNEDINAAKKSFYDALEEFMNSKYTPTEKISRESLTKLFEYKNSDWKDKNTLEKIIDYFKSIAY